MRDALPRWLEPGLAGYVRLDGARAPRGTPTSTPICSAACTRSATPTTPSRRLTATAEATGIDHAVLLTDCTGDPARTAENIARLGAEVLPRLPGRPG